MSGARPDELERTTMLFRAYVLCAGSCWGIGRSDAVLDAIRHPDVHVEEGTDVVAFLVGEPVLIESGSDGAVAAETYRITAAIAVMTMLEVGMMAMLKV